METSVFIARLIGPLYLLVGLGFLLNRDYYIVTIKKMVDDNSVFFWGGTSALIVGLLIVYHHNIWAANWTVLITIIGYMGLLKGVMLLLFPKQMIAFSKKMLDSGLYMKLTPAFALVFGGILSYFGFLTS